MKFDQARELMVKEQLKARGIKSRKVLAVFSKVKREEFVLEKYRESAYEDSPFPIGNGQTISQPYMVALMSELLDLNGTEKVLEIGTGSGYQSAILSELAQDVYSVERIEELANFAENRLARLGYFNVHIFVGDGSLGWSAFKPYDAIIVTAGAPQVSSALLAQLKPGGSLVIPVGDKNIQTLTLLKKKGQHFTKREVCGCVFVPLLGEEGWK